MNNKKDLYKMQQQIQIVRPQFLKTRDNLDLYVGFVTPLNSPFNFFVRKKDLEISDNLIYFYSYSIGKNKVILWGVYDKDNEEFLLDDNCKYSVSQMKEIVDNINKNGYEYKFSESKNRITAAKTFSDMNVSRKYARELYIKFKSYFVSNLVEYGYIKLSDIDEKDVELTYDIEDIEDVINEIISLGVKVDNGIDYKPIITKYGNTKYNTPTSLSINKYLNINNYILALLSDNEYRTLKFINYFYKNTVDNGKRKELKNYIGGKFIMIWLDDLIRALDIIDDEEFIIDLTDIMLEYYENIINREDIGVIGGPGINENEMGLLKMLSKKFDNFITKSKYTKDTYVNEMAPCPNKNKCTGKNGKCGLWNHGYHIQSEHDMR